MNATLLAEKALQKQEWPLSTIDGGLTIVRSGLLAAQDSLVHAFSTRLGGNSAEPLNWFNLGRHFPSEESKQDAIANRQVLCRALGLNADKLTVPAQQHTTNIHIVEKDEASSDRKLPEIDGAATSTPAVPLLLHFADCVPVIIFDRKRLVLCVMHAGWKGTAGGIAAKGVELLVSQWHCRATDIQAAIGPAIGSCCYPTGEDVAAQLAASITDARLLITNKAGKPHPDLKAINAMQLYERGVTDIDVSSWCTACNPQFFFSHRQSGGKTGRQGAIACLQ